MTRACQKLHVAGVLLISAAMALASCGSKALPAPTIPPGYALWPRSVDRVLNYPVPAHGSGARIIYMDPASHAAALGRDGSRLELGVGAMVVKEVYASPEPAPGDKPALLTAMVKAPDDPRAQGAWLWLVKDAKADGFTVMEKDFCVSCHVAANERHPYGDRNQDGAFHDYLFYVP